MTIVCNSVVDLSVGSVVHRHADLYCYCLFYECSCNGIPFLTLNADQSGNFSPEVLLSSLRSRDSVSVETEVHQSFLVESVQFRHNSEKLCILYSSNGC